MDLKALLDILVPIIGIGGFLFGLFQYQQAQRWKRLEFAATQLQRLYSDPELVLAATFLNYSKRGVPLPEKYWEYVGAKVFNHDCKRMYELMSKGYEDHIDNFIYSDAIDRMFEYLEQIYDFVDMKLIKAKDVEALRWILEVLMTPQWAEQEGFDKCLFVKRAVSTDHKKVIKLMKVFGYQPEICLQGQKK